MIIGTAKRTKEGEAPKPTRFYSARQEEAVAKAVSGKRSFKCIPVGFVQFIIGSFRCSETERCPDGHEVHQIAVIHCLGQLVAVGGGTLPRCEKVIDILVDLLCGGCGEAHQRSVEIMEKVPIFPINGRVHLIADYQIKMSAGEQLALGTFQGVDALHHSLISGENAVRRARFLFSAQIYGTQLG